MEIARCDSDSLVFLVLVVDGTATNNEWTTTSGGLPVPLLFQGDFGFQFLALPDGGISGVCPAAHNAVALRGNREAVPVGKLSHSIPQVLG